jgi:hypothetical protein
MRAGRSISGGQGLGQHPRKVAYDVVGHLTASGEFEQGWCISDATAKRTVFTARGTSLQQAEAPEENGVVALRDWL